MKKVLSILNWSGIALAFISCSEDDPLTVDDVSSNIEAELKPFIDTFVAEGEIRGHFFDFRGFEATFSEEEIGNNEDICGRASALDDSEPNSIIIRRNENCWIDRPDATREALVFHELGHALLNRPHRDDRFDNTLVKSIMETGMLGPYNEFSPLLRTYLIDELFDETTPDPEWSLNRTAELPIDINTDFEESTADWQFVTTPDIVIGSASGERTDEAASSGNFSLRLTNNQASEGTAFWRSQILVNGIPETADILVEVKVRMQSVQGPGVAIIAALDKSGEIISFNTTERDITLTGTSDFQTQRVFIPYYPNSLARITILFALLPNTTGLVYFDDVSVTARFNPAFGPA